MKALGAVLGACCDCLNEWVQGRIEARPERRESTLKQEIKKVLAACRNLQGQRKIVHLDFLMSSESTTKGKIKMHKSVNIWEKPPFY